MFVASFHSLILSSLFLRCCPLIFFLVVTTTQKKNKQIFLCCLSIRIYPQAEATLIVLQTKPRSCEDLTYVTHTNTEDIKIWRGRGRSHTTLSYSYFIRANVAHRKNVNVPTKHVNLHPKRIATTNHMWNRPTAQKWNSDSLNSHHSHLFFTRGLVSCRHRPLALGRQCRTAHCIR